MGMPTCVLSEDDVVIIWESAEDVNELADAFSVSLETILKIKSSLLYSHITKDLINGGHNQVKGSPPKLTHEQAVEIITTDTPIGVLAKKFNVSRSAIYAVRSGETWKHLMYLPRKKSKQLRVCPTGRIEDSWVRFTDEQVLEIIEQFPTMSNAELAKKYQVSAATISAIRCGKNYRHLTNGQAFPRSSRPLNSYNKKTKLTEEQVREIKDTDESVSNKELGIKYNVLPSTIWKIRQGINWSYLK